MCEKREVKFQEAVEKTKEGLQKRKKEYPLEWLGRSLAYNNYPPRDILPHLTSTKDEPYRFIYVLDSSFADIDMLNIAQKYEKNKAGALVVNTCPHFCGASIERITFMRRYVATPIIQKDIIIDKYQLVESIVYGADCIYLIACILSSGELKKMVEYARHLGLEVLVKIEDKEDLAKVIFSGATLLCLASKNYEKLIPLIPNGKIIIYQDNELQKERVKSLNIEGVDAFMIEKYLHENTL